MSDVFTASNGIELRTGENGWLERRNGGELGTGIWGSVNGVNTKAPALVWDALREFFDHEAGRWRSPEDPEYVVYRAPRSDDGNGRCVLVIHEPAGKWERTWESLALSVDETDEECTRAYLAAKAWFLAHPEKKPWHDAKPHEVWALTFSEEGGGGTEAWAVGAHGCFCNPSYVGHVRIQDSTITAGWRIWPEVEK